MNDAPDGSLLYEVPRATSSEIDQAVTTAAEAFKDWRNTAGRIRSAVLSGAAARLRRRSGTIAPLVTRETGRVLGQAEREVHVAAQILEQYAQSTHVTEGRLLNRASDRVWGIEVPEPVGVAALITAWNVPLQLASHKLGAALTAGCAAVLKPSPLAAHSVHFLVEALREAGLPDGVVSVLHGDGLTGRALVEHPGVAMVSFTGSERSGREVMATAAETGPKKVVLELGGKSANIVFDDACIEDASRGVVAGFIRNQGAVCTAATRILVHQKVYEPLVDRVAKLLGELRIADPYLDAADLGALRTPELGETMDAAIAHATGQGADLRAGGTVVEVPGRTGAYRRPALLTDVPADSYLHRTELLTPLATVVPFSDDEEAVELANDSQYGLAAGIWTSSTQRAERVWSALDVGTVYVNSYHRTDAIPLAASGRKRSGLGCEGGELGVAEFLAIKSVHIPRAA